jgi:hypothetical protein
MLLCHIGFESCQVTRPTTNLAILTKAQRPSDPSSNDNCAMLLGRKVTVKSR